MRASLALVVLAMVAPSVTGKGGKSMVRQSDTSVAIGSDGSVSVLEEKELARQQDIDVNHAGSGEQGRSGILPGAKIFLGIKSAPSEKYAQRRALWRQSDCAKSYAAAGISYAFFVGMPLDPSHDLSLHRQGGFETPHETAIEKAMIAENEKHQDMQILAMRDIYMDLPNKLIGLLNFAYHRTDAEYIGSHDDEYCLKPQAILDAIAEHKKSKKKELWMGGAHFAGNEYSNMEGPRGTQYHGPRKHGMVAPFMSGHGCLLSRGLLKPIIVNNIALTILHGEYGTVADDANLGKWVSLAVQKQHVDVDSVFLKTANFLTAIAKEDAKFHAVLPADTANEHAGSLVEEVAPPTVAPGLAAEEEETDEEPAEGADAANEHAGSLVEEVAPPTVAPGLFAEEDDDDETDEETEEETDKEPKEEPKEEPKKGAEAGGAAVVEEADSDGSIETPPEAKDKGSRWAWGEAINTPFEKASSANGDGDEDAALAGKLKKHT